MTLSAIRPLAACLAGALLLAGCKGSPNGGESAASPEATEEATATADATPTAAVAALPARFVATGTEPFWSAKVDGTQLTYATPEYPAGTTIPVTVSRDDVSTTYEGDIDGKPLELTITPGSCSVGPSDQKYAFTVLRTIGPDEERGCARAI